MKVLFARLFKGRVHFSKKYVGKILLMEDGQEFQVIRNLKVDQKKGQEENEEKDRSQKTIVV